MTQFHPPPVLTTYQRSILQTNKQTNKHCGSRTQRFNTADTKARRWTRSWASSIHLPSLQDRLDIISASPFVPSKCKLSQKFYWPKFCLHFLSLQMNTSIPSYRTRFHNPKNTRRAVQITKILSSSRLVTTASSSVLTLQSSEYAAYYFIGTVMTSHWSCNIHDTVTVTFSANKNGLAHWPLLSLISSTHHGDK